MSELLRTCTLKKCKFPKKKKASQKLTLPSKAANTEETVLPPPELTKEQAEKRLHEIDEYIKANKGNIPKVQFYYLKAEQAELQERLEK